MLPKEPPPILVESSYPPPFSRAYFAPRFWGTWLGMGMLWLLAVLPGGVRRSIGGKIGDLIYRRNKKRRAIVLTNLAWCFPELSEQEREAMACRYLRMMTQSFLDYGVLWWGSRKKLDSLVELEGFEHIEAQRQAGKPIILLTNHSVGLDFGAAAISRYTPIVGLVKLARNPLIDWWMAKGRIRFSCVLFRREEGIRKVVNAIKKGHAFYYLPDEDLGPENSIFVPFFGVQTATIDALSRLAKTSRAVVLPFATAYDPESGTYQARIFPALEAFPSKDTVADTARMNEELERMIRLAPEQYMWSMRIFQTRPDGSPPPYAMKGWEGSGHRERPEE